MWWIVVEERSVKRKWLNVLLIAVPLALAAGVLNRQGAYSGKLTNWIFGLCLVAVVPLASLLGQLTDRLSDFYGERVGGLLSASFGNVPELSIGILLLIHARVHGGAGSIVDSDFLVIRGLLIGSVINNILFVLGSSVFVAALRNGRMNFSAESAAGYASMLAIAVVGLALPTIATTVSATSPHTQAAISVPFGIILIGSYIAYLAASIFGIGNKPRARAAEAEGAATGERADTAGMPVLPDRPAQATLAEKIEAIEEADEPDADAQAIEKRRAFRRAHPYDVWITLIGLTLVTLFTVLIAGLLVSVTDNVIQGTALTPLSVGLILFPIVCNLGEQAGSLVEAWRNHMEGAMSVAAGSSVQVALFVTPVLVLLSFLIGGGSLHLVLTLIFRPLELIVLGLVAFVYALVSLDGETTWLEGLQLLAFYAMVVAVAFVLPGR